MIQIADFNYHSWDVMNVYRDHCFIKFTLNAGSLHVHLVYKIAAFKIVRLDTLFCH